MLLKKIFVILMILTGIIRVNAQPVPEIIDLKKALNLAVRNSVNIQQSLLEEKKLRYRQQEAKGIGLPNINATGGFDDYVNLPTQLIPGDFFGQPGTMIPVQFGTTYNLSASLSVSQILYNQVFIAALKMAKQAVEMGSLQTEQAKTNLVLEAGKTYYATQITKIQINNIRNIQQKIEKSEKVAQSQYESGIIKKTDLDRFTVEKLNLMTELDRLEVLYQQELSMEKYLMGMPQNQDFAFPDSVEMNVLPILQKNLENHIILRLIGQSRKMAATNINMKRAEYFPTLNFIGSTGYLNQSNTFYLFGKNTDWFNTSVIGLQLNVPVFDGFQKRSRVSESKVNLESLKISEEDTKKRLLITSEDAERKFTTAITAEQRQRENMKLAENVYASTQEQYQKGVIPLTDLLNVERALSEAQTLHVTALINLKIAELDYLFANGILLNLLDQ
ncbi:MAG: TolC family protein [Syntrophothermus sp.]